MAKENKEDLINDENPLEAREEIPFEEKGGIYQIQKSKMLEGGITEAEAIIRLSDNKEMTPEELLRILGKDPNWWEVVYFGSSIWDQRSKVEDKNCYAVRYKIKPRTEPKFDEKAFLDNLKKMLVNNKEVPALKRIPISRKKETGLLLEVPPIELHLGKFSWEPETTANYDHKIAKGRFNIIVEDMVRFQEDVKADKIVICVGGDFLNCDNQENQTTQGTQLESGDLRWQKMFMEGLELYEYLINNALKKARNVEIRYVPGNHDKQTSFYLYTTLLIQYRSNDRAIFTTPEEGAYRSFQGIKWGLNGIFWHHGDKPNKALISLLNSEIRRMGKKFEYVELHLGHLHKKDLSVVDLTPKEQAKEKFIEEEQGITVRRIGTPSAPDNWHTENGFIGAIGEHQLLLWGKDPGVKQIRHTNFSNTTEGKRLIKKYRKANNLRIY